MPRYNDGSVYYGPPAAVLAQGDIVVATTGAFEGDKGDVSTGSPLYFDEDQIVQVWPGSTGAPSPKRQVLGLWARWGASIIRPHACALEMEFNERVAALIAFGNEQNQAERLANDDSSLDRCIAIALLCTYRELALERYGGVRTETYLGAFRVPENPVNKFPPAGSMLGGCLRRT